jgi:hypothetical protein
MEGRRALIAIGALVVAAVIGTLLVRRDEPDRVVLLGDSIGEEAAPYLELLLHGITAHTKGGTAPCDWNVDDLGIKRGDLVVVTFTGNSFTPCMSDGAGGHLTGTGVVKRYAHDLAAMVDAATARGADVVLVGQPQRGPFSSDREVVPGLNEAYQSLADRDGVSYVDAGAAVEREDGTFAADLPCLPDEQGCAPSGRIAVRSPDGLHLCPHVPIRGCDVYSSGAFRFAAAIADAVRSR